jgi:DNA repair protein RecN (Recombination protein N)
MLRELHISNLAVIADARIELDPGLNCFTGATGAGKSLVIGALEILLGLRSPSEMLRTGADEGRVAGIFDVRNGELQKLVEQITDVPIAGDGGEMLLTRRLHASGRSSISLNGNPITLGMLKQVAEVLVDVHGQHDHQYLLKASNQLEVLDHFAGAEELRRKYHAVFARLEDAKHRLAELSANRTLREQQLELYRFQAEEIDSAQLDQAEYDELGARSSILRNLEKLKKDAGAAYAALYEADGSVLERLRMIAAIIGELATLDANLKETGESARSAAIQLEEVSFDLSRYLDRLDLDPGEITEVEERLNVIHRALNKYGGTLEETLVYRKQIGDQIAGLERATDDLSALAKEIEPLSKELKKLGDDLSSRRNAAAKKLCPLVEKELHDLGMEKAKFFAVLTKLDQPTPSGYDGCEFMGQTNPGLPAQPLRKIASGGELSRVMLGLKGILAQADRVSVLVFDEIDSNVGGRLGSVIGTKLRRLSNTQQVLCITHLPQIAAYADRHLTVRKQTDGTQTTTRVARMEGTERLEEIAEMIGGHRITETTRAQARELIDSATADGDRVPKTTAKTGATAPAAPPAAPPAGPTAKTKGPARVKAKS